MFILQAAAGLMKSGEKPPRLTPQEIIEFVFFPVVNEGCRVIAEGIVDKPADLDVATVLAMGFPAYRCALLFLFMCSLIHKGSELQHRALFLGKDLAIGLVRLTNRRQQLSRKNRTKPDMLNLGKVHDTLDLNF